MPTGPPEFFHESPDAAETTADRLIREAMEGGQFDDLPGTGTPIPGAGSVDDEGWWFRSWIERNHDPGAPPGSDGKT